MYESQGEVILSTAWLREMVSTASYSKRPSPASCLWLYQLWFFPIITSASGEWSLRPDIENDHLWLVLCHHWRRVLLESLNKLYLPGSLGALRAWIQKGNPEAHAIMQALLRKGHLETLTGKKKSAWKYTPVYFWDVYHLLITYIPFSLDTHSKLNKNQCKNEARQLFPRCTEITIAAVWN